MTHAYLKPFIICDTIGKLFSRPGRLKQHEMTHQAIILSHVKSGEFKIHERNIIICTCDTCVLNREGSKYTICRALGSPTPFASVITHYTGTAYAATTNGRVVAKADTLYVTLPSGRYCFRVRGNTNRTSGGRHGGRPPCR